MIADQKKLKALYAKRAKCPHKKVSNAVKGASGLMFKHCEDCGQPFVC